MERVLTQEDRIRRAEEIYLKRRSVRPQYRETREIASSKHIPTGKSIKLFKRMILQIVICLLLYCIFYLIYDTNYAFSDTTISTTQEILNYDISFNEIYNYLNEKIMSFINKEESSTEENKNEENIDEQSISSEEETNEVNSTNDITNEEQNGQEEIIDEVRQTSAVEPDLKQLYHLTLPVTGGYVSSEFGERESTSEIVSTDHKGIDIAVAERYRYYVCNRWKSSCIYYISYVWKLYNNRKRRIENSICSL